MKTATVEQVRLNAITLLREEQKNDDIESAHGKADDILCELLRVLGFADVVKEYHKINKWYA